MATIESIAIVKCKNKKEKHVWRPCCRRGCDNTNPSDIVANYCTEHSNCRTSLSQYQEYNENDEYSYKKQMMRRLPLVVPPHSDIQQLKSDIEQNKNYSRNILDRIIKLKNDLKHDYDRLILERELFEEEYRLRTLYENNCVREDRCPQNRGHCIQVEEIDLIIERYNRHPIIQYYETAYTIKLKYPGTGKNDPAITVAEIIERLRDPAQHVALQKEFNKWKTRSKDAMVKSKSMTKLCQYIRPCACYNDVLVILHELRDKIGKVGEVIDKSSEAHVEYNNIMERLSSFIKQHPVLEKRLTRVNERIKESNYTLKVGGLLPKIISKLDKRIRDLEYFDRTDDYNEEEALTEIKKQIIDDDEDIEEISLIFAISRQISESQTDMKELIAHIEEKISHKILSFGKSVRKKKSIRKVKKSVRKTKKSVRKTKKSVRKTKKSVRK